MSEKGKTSRSWAGRTHVKVAALPELPDTQGHCGPEAAGLFLKIPVKGSSHQRVGGSGAMAAAWTWRLQSLQD